jgi:hypothetical protein
MRLQSFKLLPMAQTASQRIVAKLEWKAGLNHYVSIWALKSKMCNRYFSLLNQTLINYCAVRHVWPKVEPLLLLQKSSNCLSFRECYMCSQIRWRWPSSLVSVNFESIRLIYLGQNNWTSDYHHPSEKKSPGEYFLSPLASFFLFLFELNMVYNHMHLTLVFSYKKIWTDWRFSKAFIQSLPRSSCMLMGISL